MPARTNEDIIRIVKKWQDGPLIHELTCREDSRHPLPQPVERDGAVVLVCPKCGSAQTAIPEAVLSSEAALDYAAERNLEWVRRQRAREAAQDVWWMIVVVMTCGTVFGGMTFGLPGAALGAVAAACVAAALASRTKAKNARDVETRP